MKILTKLILLALTSIILNLESRKIGTSLRSALLILFFAFETLNCFAQWQVTNCPPATCPAFAVSGNNIFAGTSSGVFLSTDNGNSWAARNNGLTDTMISSLAISGNNIFAGTYFDGVFLSTNNGSSWTKVNKGLLNTHVYSLAASGSNIFLGTWDGRGTLPDDIYLFTNNDSSWTAVGYKNGLMNPIISSLAISGTNIFAGTTNGVYLSTNNGNSWTKKLSAKLGAMTVGISGTSIFATRTFDSDSLYLSTNNGNSWTAGNGLSRVMAFETSGTDIFAGTRDSGVYLSTNNGSSWTTVNKGLPYGISARSLAISGSTIFIGTDGGVWKRALSDILAGIEENSTSNGHFILYPNPAKDIITLSFSSKEKVNIIVFDVLGNVLSNAKQNRKEDTYQIDLSAQQAGVYFIKVQSEKGSEMKKVVVVK